MEPNTEHTPFAVNRQYDAGKFLDDSLIKTPDPQACSTVNRPKDLDDIPITTENKVSNFKDGPKFLVDERNTIGSLHQKLNQMFEQMKRESVSSNRQTAVSEVNSSLGILKLDDLEDLNETYSSKVLESIMPKKIDDCEASWKMKRELARQSVSSIHSSGKPSLKFGMELEKDFSINRFSSSSTKPEKEEKRTIFNPFDGGRVSDLPEFDEEFDSGTNAKQRLLEDEKKWMQTNADLPVSNCDTSLSGIFTGDEAAGNISSVSTFLRCGSGPLGTLEGRSDQIQRPNFGTEIFSPVKPLDVTGCIADVLPKDCSMNQTTADAGLDLSVSTIASITQIKEMLGEMGQNSPTQIINKLMNGEGRKKTKQGTKVEGQKKSENNHYKRKENISTIDLTTDDDKKSISTSDDFLLLKPSLLSSQRNALKDMTNMQRSPIKIIDLETDSTVLEPSSSKILDNTGEQLHDVVSNSFMCSNNGRESNASCLEIHSDSFVVGPLSRSTSIEDIEKTSSCNSFMNNDDNDDEEVQLKYCIGSICNLVITLSNSSLDNELDCSISLVRVLKNKEPCPKAVKIVFPPDIRLAPGESKAVEIQIIPFAIGLLEIGLQVDEVEHGTECTRSLVCAMKIKSEKPRLIISKVPEDECSNNSKIDFGLLPEESLRKSVISIENVGNVKVPLNINIIDLSSQYQVFYMLEADESEVIEKLILLEPGEKYEETIYCLTPPLNRNNGCQSQTITGRLAVSLASIVRDSNVFARFDISTTVGFTTLLISPNCNPLVVPAYEKRPLLIRNASVVPLTLNVVIEDSEFSIESNVLYLDSNQEGSIAVEFSPLRFQNNGNRTTKLWLCIDSTDIRYEVKIVGQNHGLITSTADSISRPKSVMTSSTASPHGSKTTTPYASRSSSPCSTNLSAAEKGTLDLACTHSALVWASCPLQLAERKGCVLRNKNCHKEKLLLTVVDNSGCFKSNQTQGFSPDDDALSVETGRGDKLRIRDLVEEKGNTVQEMRINLEGMESRQVTVSMCPLQVGACKGTLIITRANQKPVCGQPNRKVLHLYGYGGKAVLNIRGVNKDPEHKMWMYLDPINLRAHFVLENSGDGTAFVRISQDIADTGVIITPQESLIPAHKKITVDLSFAPTSGRADHLLSECQDSDVLVVTRVKIMFGDESTRLRLKRLYRKMIGDRTGMDSLLMEKLSVLDNLFPGTGSTEIACLKDTQASIKTLWVEGIRETSIGVMLDKSALENAQLDATAQFIDLATTVTDDTVYIPKQQLIVAPRVVNLSWTQPSASFTLRNTTVLPIRVQIESVSGLSVEPSSYTIETHSSCTITVTQNSGCDIASSAILKIYSDCTDVIEVPVNWNKKTQSVEMKDEQENDDGNVFSTDYDVIFPSAVVGGKTVARVCLCNTTRATKMILVENVDGPFEVRISEFPLKGRWYLNLRIYFRPSTSGEHCGTLIISVDKEKFLTYKLSGKAFYKLTNSGAKT